MPSSSSSDELQLLLLKLEPMDTSWLSLLASPPPPLLLLLCLVDEAASVPPFSVFFLVLLLGEQFVEAVVDSVPTGLVVKPLPTPFFLLLDRRSI